MFLLFIALGIYAIKSNNIYLRYIKSFIPLEVKIILKDTIFYYPTLNDSYINSLVRIQNLEHKVGVLMAKKNAVNVEFLPYAQFLKLDYNERSLKEINLKRYYNRYGNIVKPFYIEILKNEIILSMKDGSVYSTEINKLYEDIDAIKFKNF